MVKQPSLYPTRRKNHVKHFVVCLVKYFSLYVTYDHPPRANLCFQRQLQQSPEPQACAAFSSESHFFMSVMRCPTGWRWSPWRGRGGSVRRLAMAVSGCVHASPMPKALTMPSTATATSPWCTRGERDAGFSSCARITFDSIFESFAQRFSLKNACHCTFSYSFASKDLDASGPVFGPFFSNHSRNFVPLWRQTETPAAG
jgi:hypothetical protein